MGAEISEPFDPLAPGEAKPKAKRAPRAKKDAPADPLVPGEVKPKAKRASRAKPKATAAVSAETLPDTDTGNVAIPELTREVSFAFGGMACPVPAEEKAAEPLAKPKAVRKPRAKKDAPAESVPMAESPKWLKFKADVEEGKFDALREDGQYHPGKLSIRVSGALATNPEWRPLLSELLKSRGRFEVMRIFGL